jgi:hypothetical protein
MRDPSPGPAITDPGASGYPMEIREVADLTAAIATTLGDCGLPGEDQAD